MSSPTLPSISSLLSLPASDQLQALDTLFEPSAELHALVQPILSAQTFSTYSQLVDAIQNKFSELAADSTTAKKQTLYGILGSHPRLGAPSPAAQANLSELSRREQANLNSSNNSTDGPSAADLAAQLASLNKEYEETYPGLRYVTFVNGRGRDVIMVDMRRRISRANIELEVQDNIQGYVLPRAIHIPMAEVLIMADDAEKHDGVTSKKTDSTRLSSALGRSNSSNGIASPATLHVDQEDGDSNARQSLTLTAQIDAASGQSQSSPDNLNASSESPIDPLSQHILKRTQTERSIPLKLRSQPSHGQDSVGDGTKPGPTEQTVNRADSVGGVKPSKEKKNRVSFLSRFIGTKKGQTSNTADNVSEAAADEASGMDDLFAHPIGFIPRFPPPPKYIKVKAHSKKQKTFDKVFLAQELSNNDEDVGKDEPKSSNKAIWAMVFSKDGKYLATAGQDKVVRVWAVITNAQDREAHEQEEEEGAKGDGGWRLTAPVFKAKPIREYTGHTGSVLDLSWSKNNFLLSSSMDWTVRLWHVSRSECLCCFKHSDFVTSIQFHPRDDRFFLAGSLDSKLRLWSIPDKSVAFWATVRDMITAVAFTPDGKYSIAGCLNGLCILYETDGLKANAQVHVRSARGKNAKGSKITGIDTMFHPPNDPNGEVKLLITSNDSRIRLYNFRDRNLEAKYRGNENSTSQIRASFSDDGKFIICGSEDRRTYIWSTGSVDREPDKRAVEELETRTSIVTSAIMAPIATKQLLGLSGDPLYDLCNPPPITLVSQADSNPSSMYSEKKGTKPKPLVEFERPIDNPKTKQGSPSYIARSAHPDGNIILAADYSGRIKVFRQDCAYKKRPSDWDAGSTFSKKFLGRSNSARHSIASSIGRESKTPSERILAWRSSVTGTELASLNSPAGTIRSHSPRKSRSQNRVSSPDGSVATKTQSGYASPRTDSVENVSEMTPNKDDNKTPRPRAETDNLNNIPQFSEYGHSNAFWTKGAEFARSATLQQQGQEQRRHRQLDPNAQNDPARRISSVPSALSSDLSSSGPSHDDSGEDDEVLRCPRCRGTNFRATKARGKQKLTRITTKYSYPSSSSSSKGNTNSKRITTQDPTTATTTTPIATLTLKTFNPVTGICLKYRTNKAAEVGRLISGLGKLAAGTKISSSSAAVGLGEESATVPAAGAATGAATAGDVEMTDAPAAASTGVGVGGTGAGAGGGGGKKKKGGKGKR
ncbi:putative WD repeat-containing protein C3H5,08c [Talaromyces islandicus]|uniref:Putative WD repeat-containing protein C3H5,08c n=1 Tax=Talaromyces islandicus TaxID=28573 RepID=A0A0U1M523_TALIS|nr:putative WD repeat-containing protein C3H5,08c [Talaromyces islandicus]